MIDGDWALRKNEWRKMQGMYHYLTYQTKTKEDGQASAPENLRKVFISYKKSDDDLLPYSTRQWNSSPDSLRRKLFHDTLTNKS